ncbi:MAG TPA: class I SAM-dependent methyltransferase [Opitutaceae bacterium]|nr:class I SAM-dependent methyltransferase [Opitutaceae bacterium]
MPDLYSGWDDYYRAGTLGVPVWSESPPDFVKDFRKVLPTGSKILEMCAGDGRITALLLRWGLVVTALDLSPAALKQMRANLERVGCACPMMVQGSVLDIPLADEQFDAVVCVDGFCQIDLPRDAMREVARMLRTGGKFCLNVFTPADETCGCGEQIGAQDYMYRGTLFKFFNSEQFAGIYEGIFNLVEVSHSRWTDPPHGEFRPVTHTHDALIYTLEKI